MRERSFSSPGDKDGERHLASFYLTPLSVTQASVPKVLKEKEERKKESPQNHRPTRGQFWGGIANLNPLQTDLRFGRYPINCLWLGRSALGSQVPSEAPFKLHFII